jgi:signal peptidase
MKYAIPIPILIITVYLLANIIVPYTFRGNIIFLVDALLWAIPIAATILITKLMQTTMRRTDKTLIQLAAIIAVFQVFLSVFTAFFMGFGKNANVWTPATLAVYFPYLLIPFIATELSRAYLAQSTSKNKPTLQILLISLFLTLISTTIPRYLDLTTPLAISEFLIRTFIPALATSLLATYLAYLGGFPANLAYMAIPAFFTWFSPILPNPPWAAQSILTVIATTTGFLILDTAIKPLPTKHIHRTLKKQKNQLPYWTAIALIGIIAVWSSTGLLGFTPSIIASRSMRPALDVGDIAVTLQTSPENIRVGDVIQYWRQGESAPIIHRVIETYKSGGTTYIITKGDANNAPDDPITPIQTVGKLIITIPKLGWISIYLKTAITTAASFLQNNIIASCATIGLILTYSAFRIHKYKNQPLNKLKRKFRR